MKWIFSNTNPKLVLSIQAQYRISPIMASILAERGLLSTDETNSFFEDALVMGFKTQKYVSTGSIKTMGLTPSRIS